MRSQGAATDTEPRPRRQLRHGVVNAAPRICLKHPKTTEKHALVSPLPPSQTRDLKVCHEMKNLKDTNRGCRTRAQNTCVADNRSYQELLRPPSPIDRLALPARLYCHLVHVGTESCACRRTPCPSPFQYPESYPLLDPAVKPRSEHRFYTAVGLLLL